MHVKLNNGTLRLEPLALGLAGGSLVGQMTIDANVAPAAFDTKFDLRADHLNRMFPTIKNTRSGF